MYSYLCTPCFPRYHKQTPPWSGLHNNAMTMFSRSSSYTLFCTTCLSSYHSLQYNTCLTRLQYQPIPTNTPELRFVQMCMVSEWVYMMRELVYMMSELVLHIDYVWHLQICYCRYSLFSLLFIRSNFKKYYL